MRYLSNVGGVAIAALAFAAFAPAAAAQDVSKVVCQHVGASGAPEPLGDREGHALEVATESCRVEGGAMDGGVLTGQAIFEWDKTDATLVSNIGVVRKPGATLVYQATEVKVVLTIADGKVTGFTATGRGRYPIASGSATSLAGKTFTFKTKSTGPGVWETDSTIDVAAQ